MEIIGPINLIVLLSIAFAAFMMFLLNLEFDHDPAEKERQRKLKEYRKFFNL